MSERKHSIHKGSVKTRLVGNLEVLELGQHCPLCKLQVGACNHALLALVKLEGHLVCNSAALY